MASSSVPGKVLRGVSLVLLSAAVAGQELSRVAEVRSLRDIRGATVTNASESLGKVDDLLMDLGSGSIRALILTASTATGRRTLEVPYELVTWSFTSGGFLTNMAKTELDDIETFEPQQYGPFSEHSAAKAAGTSPLVVADGAMLASELSNLALRFLGGEEDKLRGVSVELYTGEIAFVTVSRAGSRAAMDSLHPVPWGALRVFGVSQGIGRPRLPQAILRAGPVQLVEAPSFRDGAIDDPLFRAEVYAFHRVRTPGFESLN